MPYRINFFAELGKLCDLTVVFGIKNKGYNQTWMNVESKNLYYMFLGYKGDQSISFFQMFKLLNKNKFDIFVVDGYSDLKGMVIINILRLKKIPFVLNSDGSFIKEGISISNIIKRRIIKCASYWNCSGEYTKKTLVHYNAIENRVFTYPLTSLYEKDILTKPVSITEKEEIKKELGIRGKRIAIAVGRFVYRKGFDALINAWNDCKLSNEYELIIIGEGILKNKYKEYISKFNISNITIVDFKQKNELFKYYKAADVFVLPTREDIWGLVVNEAMACGLPIISTDRCIAALELVDDFENGFIVTVDNAEMLSQKLKIVFDDLNLLNKMRTKSLEKIKGYTIENMAKQHFNLFTSLSKSKTN